MNTWIGRNGWLIMLGIGLLEQVFVVGAWLYEAARGNWLPGYLAPNLFTAVAFTWWGLGVRPAAGSPSKDSVKIGLAAICMVIGVVLQFLSNRPG